jgi:hypothetical protein
MCYHQSLTYYYLNFLLNDLMLYHTLKIVSGMSTLLPFLWTVSHFQKKWVGYPNPDTRGFISGQWRNSTYIQSLSSSSGGQG